METKYNHKQVEKGKNNIWIENEVFKSNETKKKNYSIVLPPPNVTGKLHLGHAWDGTLQDIMVRFKKMQGYNVLWLPGMDHAGIATQTKVDQRLRMEGTSAREIGREKFIQQALQWKEEYAEFIRSQWGALGLGLDYSKEKFTLDDDIHEKVYEVFKKLYDERLIVKGDRIINWDSEAQTAISDIEVEHKEVEGQFYYLKYKLVEEEGYLEVATTRPETLFADVCVAVNPTDERFQHLVGKYCFNPATKKKLEIITDDFVDKDFGTGAVKISPAHDPNDYEVYQRNPKFKPIIIFNNDGTLNKNGNEFEGLNRFEVRKKLIKKLENENLVVKIEKHLHNVAHSERTGAIIEPLLSEQWFLKMPELAKQAIKIQKAQEGVNFFPKRFEKIYLTWIESSHDWCISRQLWWGHRIPVWYHKVTNEIYVDTKPPKDIENWRQETDVLDTWFSSALWPFATMSEEIKERFFPTSLLVTGYDIIFFWVSRMIVQSIKFENVIPFKDVLIHGLVRDSEGRKMSKSLGNGIDPLETINKYGADSLRYFLTTSSTPGQDLRYSDEKLSSTWNFMNKIWNISRYILGETAEVRKEYFTIEKNIGVNKYLEQQENLLDIDKYILKQSNEMIAYIIRAMEKYEFTEVKAKFEDFVWDDFASNYLEISKIIIRNEQEKVVKNTKIILLKLLFNIIEVLHPFAPFITEEIYSYLLDDEEKREFLVNQKYPELINIGDFKNRFFDIQEIIQTIRNFKAENDIKPSKEVIIALNKTEEFSDINEKIIKGMAKVEKIIYNEEISNKKYTKVLRNSVLNILLEGLIDKNEVFEKLNIQKVKLEKELIRSQKMLMNENFINNANEEKTAEEKQKAKQYVEQYKKLEVVYEKENLEFKEFDLTKLLERINWENDGK